MTRAEEVEELRALNVTSRLRAAGCLPFEILPWLTPLAALGPMLTMTGAALTHLRRSEYSVITVPAVLFILAAFVAYSRFFVLPA